MSAPRKLRRSISSSSFQSLSFLESVFATSARVVEELFHRCRNLDDVGLDRKMTGIKELNLRARYVLSKGFCSRGNEERIVLAPDREQRRFRLTKIFLEFRIKLYVRRIIQKQIELNLFVSGPFEQSRIQCVRLRRNTFRIRYAVGVLPARSSRRQNSLAEYVPDFLPWGRPSIFGSGPKPHRGLLRMRSRSAKQWL